MIGMREVIKPVIDLVISNQLCVNDFITYDHHPKNEMLNIVSSKSQEKHGATQKEKLMIYLLPIFQNCFLF